MINTENYNTKEFTPAPGAHAYSPSSRLRRPKSQRPASEVLSERDLDFLTDFIKVSAFYVEDLEDYLGEELLDFWQSREHALEIITDVILERAEVQ
jgi:hypothetical protein